MCAGRTASAKNCTSPPPVRWQPPSPGSLKWIRGNGRGACSLAAVGRPPPPPSTQASLGLTSRGKSSQRSGVEVKRQLTGKFILPETRVANCSVELDPQPQNTIKYSASTPNKAQPHTLPLTHSPDEGTPLLDWEPPSLIHIMALSALTPPSPVRPTPDPLCPDQLALTPLSPSAPRPNSVTFGPGIAEALLYATTAHVPYPPPVAPLADDLAATAKATTREIFSVPSLLSFLSIKQRKTLRGLPKGVRHTSADLLWTYVDDLLLHPGLTA